MRGCGNRGAAGSYLKQNYEMLAERVVRDDGVFDAVEIGPSRFPIIGVADELDRLVRLELDEFEWAGADRMLAHFAR